MPSFLNCFVQFIRLFTSKPHASHTSNSNHKSSHYVPAQPATVDYGAESTSASVGHGVAPLSTAIPEPSPTNFVPKIAVRTPTETVTTLNDRSAWPGEDVGERLRPSREDSVSSSQRSRADSKGSSTSGHWLKEQLENARVECHHHPHCFLVPKCEQERLINFPTVLKDIQARTTEYEDAETNNHAKNACARAQKLYATLAYIKKGGDICQLLAEGVTDDDLPFVRKHDERSRFSLYRKNGSPIKTLETWKDKYLENFDRIQWWMNAAVFQSGEYHELGENVVLPFVHFDADDETTTAKRGGYSEVYPVRIHPAHHDFWSDFESLDDEPLVAVKALYSPEETEFMKERSILEKLGPENHPHLIKLLATYRQKQKYHLLFPFATSNLRKYWDDHPLPTFDERTVLWSLAQMTGIASGLGLIHDFRVTYPLSVAGAGAGAGEIRIPQGDVQLRVRKGEQFFGRHGDIKPENILWFANAGDDGHPMGVLKVADFGLGRFHGRDSRSRVNPDTVPTSPTYEPPECKLRLPVSRAYDIWSLGCIYLEFITWLLKGSTEIEGFSEFRGREATGTGINDDNFFTITTGGAKPTATVREQVYIWSNELHAHEKCSQLIHDLLDLTMQGLLVINSEKRTKAISLYRRLSVCLSRAKEDSTYMLKPVPRRRASSAERSNSTPETQFKVSVYNLPKDLVFRGSGTPSLNARHVGNHSTWPIDTRVLARGNPV